MNDTPKKKTGFQPSIVFGSRGSIDAEALRDLATNHPESFTRKITDCVADGTISLAKIRDIRILLDRLIDVKIPVHLALTPGGQERAITTSAFPFLTGNVVAAAMNEAYTAVPTIGGQLVTEMESDKKWDYIAGVQVLDVKESRREEGQEFPEIGAAEEKFAIGNLPNGRRISITQEMIDENNIPGIVTRVNALGEIAAEWEEELTLRRVCDIDGSGTSPAEPYVLRIGSTGTALYQTDNSPLSRLPATGNRLENNALVDETDLDAARLQLANMTNERGKRVNIPLSQCQLVVPNALLGKALKIRGSQYVPGVENELNNWGPSGAFQPAPLSSPKLDDLSTTTWYLGDFRKQFIRKYKLRFEYVTLNMDAETYLRTRIAFQARVAWDIEVGARDYVYVIQNLSGTTAP